VTNTAAITIRSADGKELDFDGPAAFDRRLDALPTNPALAKAWDGFKVVRRRPTTKPPDTAAGQPPSYA
jgi:hypothetical protein